ncbi:MAG: hypothetical protein WBB82_17990 [Limnothrix sp.]
MYQDCLRYLSKELILFLLIALVGCTSTSAPIEFAPEGDIIQQTILTKLNAHHRNLSKTIAASPPQLQLKNISVEKIDSFFLNRLPIYHLQGFYDLNLAFANQQQERRHNAFDIYLQRQKEGKTWRSLEKTASGWRSYQLK